MTLNQKHFWMQQKQQETQTNKLVFKNETVDDMCTVHKQMC